VWFLSDRNLAKDGAETEGRRPPIDRWQDKSRKVRRGRMGVMQGFLSRIRKVRIISAMCDSSDAIVLVLIFVRCSSDCLNREE
jgi:hypothetical protein